METFVLVASMVMGEHTEKFAHGTFLTVRSCQQFLYIITVSHLPPQADFAMGRCMPTSEYLRDYSHLPLGDRDT